MRCGVPITNGCSAIAITQTATRAPLDQRRRGRFEIGLNSRLSIGSLTRVSLILGCIPALNCPRSICPDVGLAHEHAEALAVAPLLRRKLLGRGRDSLGR